MDNRKFAELVTERRKILNMTQKELAQKLNVTDKAISKWERGKSLPDISLLSQLAEKLEISLLELMNEDKALIKDPDQSETVSLVTSTANYVGKQYNRKYRLIWLALVALSVLLAFFIVPELTKKTYPEPIEEMWVSAGFYAFEGHDAIDIVNADMIAGNATELYSIERGTISDFGMSQTDGYFIKIDYKEFQVIYSHLDNLEGITNRIVEKGEIIAFTGKNSSGNNTGPHIEMQVISNDVIVDPMRFLGYE